MAIIENIVKSCVLCQQNRPSPAPLHPWEWPLEPWSRLHIDFAGPFMGHMFMVLVDAHSKWLEVHIMHSITAKRTIELLRIIFATHGLPRKIVTDNGPTFTSHEFSEFLSLNGIKHLKSAPYHPSTNGLAERAVQTFKNALKRMSVGTIQDKLSKFLFTYHSTTGNSSAELLMGRRLRSKLDFLYPDIAQQVGRQQLHQKILHDTQKPEDQSYFAAERQWRVTY